jgi:glycosyltransferase involved in cell wall biosynthesis
MRIAYLHYLTADDMALHHVRQFADAARGLGHTVDVHAMNFAASPGGGGAEHSPLRARMKRRARRWLHDPKELIWNARYIARELRVLRAERPDVLLVRDHLPTVSCVPVARRLDLPLVLELNAPAAEVRLHPDGYVHLPWLPERLEAWKLRAADAVTVVSSSLKQYLTARYGIAADKIVVVPNGADVDAFRPDVAPDAAVVTGGPVVGFVGSFQSWHGTGLFAALMQRVAAARPAARFVLVGDGPDAGLLRNAAASLGDRALFTGMVPHRRVPALVAALDVGVLPAADFYRCPLKVVEWMAAGRAVVAADHPPLRDLLTDGAEGVLFPPGDREALTAAVIGLIDDAGRRRAIGAAAAARVRAGLTWTHNAGRVIAACEAARQRRSSDALARVESLRPL